MKKGLGIAAVVVFVFLLIFYVFGYYANYSSGFRVGVPMKVSKKGIIMKTHEGQLNVGGFGAGTDGNMTTLWQFSVPSSADTVLPKLDRAIEQGKRVKLFYQEKFIKLPWRGETKYMVYDVQEVK
jgi:hypothetical protein